MLHLKYVPFSSWYLSRRPKCFGLLRYYAFEILDELLNMFMYETSITKSQPLRFFVRFLAND